MVELDYRNLESCRVKVVAPTGSAGSPIKLPQECRDAGSITVPSQYDFSLEKSILKKSNDYEIETSESQEDLHKNMLVRMKSLTKAEEDVCVSLLENNKYDLMTSVEAYFHSSKTLGK